MVLEPVNAVTHDDHENSYANQCRQYHHLRRSKTNQHTERCYSSGGDINDRESLSRRQSERTQLVVHMAPVCARERNAA